MDKNELKTIADTLMASTPFSIERVVFAYDDEQKMHWYSIATPESNLLIGKNGETLQALNHLVRRIIETKIAQAKSDEPAPVLMIDINNYQKNHIDNLKSTAHMMAERARYFKSSIDVDAMPPHERRIIHEFLSEMPDIKTESVGEGVKRHIVIRYIDSKI